MAIRLLGWILAAAVLVPSWGCGGRTAPLVDRDASVGPDAPPMDAPLPDGFIPDGFVPDTPPDAGPVVVDCGMPERWTSPRRTVDLEGTVMAMARVTFEGWSLVTSPPGATVVLAPEEGPFAQLTQDREGDYVVRFTAQDALGREGSCEVTVHSVVGPPVAICPRDEILTGVGEPVMVVGDGYDDDEVVSYQWRIVASPMGSSPTIMPRDAPITTFVSDMAGTYRLSLTVADPDMATNTCTATVRVIAPPMLVCPGPIRAPTRREVTITVDATDDTGIASMRWEVIERPAGSTATPRPPTRATTRFTPDRQGRYLLRFTAVDDDGLSATCDVVVIGTPTPPDAVCPMTVETTPLTEVELVGDGVDDGMIVGWRWRLVSGPPGSAAAPPAPPNAQRTRFTPDLAGEYTIELTVIDDDGQRGTCTFLVRAIADEGIRVEMFWDQPRSDMDTHLLQPSGTSWFNNDDCYYANCNSSSGAVLEWGMPGPDDNPRLDLDDVDGFGPENINVDRPFTGTYRVGIHAFRGEGLRNAVTVRIYCGGSSTTPRQTFGPVVLRGSSGSSMSNEFWRVADIEILSAGRCRITSLLNPDGTPNIATGTDAQSRR